MSLTNEEKKKLIALARFRQREKAERERLQKEFSDEHFGVTEEEYEEIEERVQREIDEENQAEEIQAEEQERLRIEELNTPRKVQVEYKISVENKNEKKQESKEANKE